tara:strand:- start:76783 stop:79527 length:2745 start_codon:yes stop_codon:yes gene_type:complete
MKSFLEEVVEEVWEEYGNLDNVIFVLPSKRAGTFLKNSIAKRTSKTIFAPRIYSIETFVEEISGLSYASNTEQLFQLYECYLDTMKGEMDSFFTFSKWGQTLLQDITEIDRYLIDAHEIFSYLSAIKELDHWSLQREKTKMMTDYIHFWQHLEALYSKFNARLLAKGTGHQGLVYRQACDQLDDYLVANRGSVHIFIGFNALNAAESKIVQHILASTKSDIYWDIDPELLEDPLHDAGLFIRKHLKDWPVLRKKALKGIRGNSRVPKNISVVGVPKNVSQAKYVGQLLGQLASENGPQLKNTAVVLGDENLLNPLMNAVPKEIEGVNITMGQPLKNSTMASFVSQLFELYLKQDPQGWYYQDLLTFLSHPYTQIYLSDDRKDKAHVISEAIKNNNWTYIGAAKLQQLLHPENTPIPFLNQQSSPAEFLRMCSLLILDLREKFKNMGDTLGLEYLYRFHTLFNQLDQLLASYPFIKDLKSLQGLYRELLSSETLDFKGEPLEGLQLMGMLESRNLDFETVIITSVNEGILPSGKSNNSFIPFDVKISFGLPTYKEKDAVYTYHFYRLLQRAQNVYLIYNTAPDALEGGEKSRLITQILTDGNNRNNITERIAAPQLKLSPISLDSIQKDEDLMTKLRDLAKKGFSPTSLTNYIRNPLDFYKRSILRIDDSIEVEENVAANTFGTIVHDSLEELYTSLVGKYLDKELLLNLLPQVAPTVHKQFKKTYADGDISRGKNLLAYHVVLQYIRNLIHLEIEASTDHRIKILYLEQSWQMDLTVPELDFPVVLKGKLDRIDEMDGMLRIIDYKTGNVLANQVELVDWEDLPTSYDYSKAFQLLCYALLYHNRFPVPEMEAGIFSFKNLGAGLLRFAQKDKKGGRNRDYTITPETIALFKPVLTALIAEICNPEIPFREKEV